MWIYVIPTGQLYLPQGDVLAICYSGAPGFTNDITKISLPFQGPIPVGDWRIGPPYTHPRLGAMTMDLFPLVNTITYGRDDFRLHGDSIENAGKRMASDGCIVAPLFARADVAKSPDHWLRTVAKYGSTSLAA